MVEIPVGKSAAPHMTSIYLHIYEHEYITYLYGNISNDKLAKLQNILRYQDDLLVLNDDSLFKKVLKFILLRW